MGDVRFPHSLKVGLTDVEAALLQFLKERTHESQADQVRRAIWIYARQHPAFDAELFERTFAGELRRHVRDGDRRKLLDQQLQQLAPNPDLNSTAGLGPIRPFTTTASVFDED